MDLYADKIVVLDLEDLMPKQESTIVSNNQQQLALKQLNEIRQFHANDDRLCLNREVITLSTCIILAFTCSVVLAFLWRYWRKNKF